MFSFTLKDYGLLRNGKDYNVLDIYAMLWVPGKASYLQLG